MMGGSGKYPPSPPSVWSSSKQTTGQYLSMAWELDSGHRWLMWIIKRIWFKRDTGLKSHVLSASSHDLCSRGRMGGLLCV